MRRTAERDDLVRRTSTRGQPWAKLVVLTVAFLGVSLLIAHGSLYLQGLFLDAAVFAILALSLDLVAGTTGMYSLGHAGLFAFGAFGTAVIAADWHWNVFVILPVVVVGVAVIGAMIGVVALRVGGLYFAVITFVFTLIVSALASELAITGGPDGLIGPTLPTLPGSGVLGSSIAWCIMMSLFVAVVVVWNIRKSPLFAVLLAIRDAEPYAQSAGVNTGYVKIGIFAISAGLAGLAGWAFAFLGVVSYSQFGWTVSVNILVSVLFGGINTIVGPIVGASVISIFPAYVNINPLWEEVIFGALLLVVIVAMPTGVVGVVGVVIRRLRSLTDSWKGHRVRVPGLASEVAGPAPEGLEAQATRKASLVASDTPMAEVGRSDDRVTLDSADRGTRDSRRLGRVDGYGVPSGAPAIECCGVTFRYTKDGEDVVSGVDLSVAAGTIHGLIGPNGSGKTTLVDLIAGRRSPDRGSISVNGKVVTYRGPERRADYGLMRTFQSPTLVGELSVLQNVMVGLYTKMAAVAVRAIAWPLLPGSRRLERSIELRAASVLEWVGAKPWQDRRVSSVPHGVEQLTQLAAAYGPEPSALILDEPLAGLSATEAENVVELLRGFRERGVAVILIEHQTRFVFSLCDVITVLSAGEVIVSGTPADVYSNTRVREVYLGQ